MDSGHHSYSEYGPAGVVAAISPWNFPLMMASWKIAPAIAWGNTCIIKPSEDTPASVTMLGRLAAEAGLPPGVINVLNGHGVPAGSSLTADERVDRVTFTGSSTTGKAVMSSAASHLAPVSLELGGKGANIVFDDANLVAAVNGSAWAIFHNQGQACIAGSRLILHEKIADAFLDKFIALAITIPVLLALVWLIQRTRQGKAMRATAQDMDASAMMGINVNRTISFTFVIAGALAGAAGLVYSLYFTSVRYDQGFQLGLIAFTAAVLGGIGNLPGAVLGATLIGLLQGWNEGLSWHAPGSDWTESIVFSIRRSLRRLRTVSRTTAARTARPWK